MSLRGKIMLNTTLRAETIGLGRDDSLIYLERLVFLSFHLAADKI